eukprot:3472993-Rhodomonas_salina.3
MNGVNPPADTAVLGYLAHSQKAVVKTDTGRIDLESSRRRYQKTVDSCPRLGKLNGWCQPGTVLLLVVVLVVVLEWGYQAPALRTGRFGSKSCFVINPRQLFAGPDWSLAKSKNDF